MTRQADPVTQYALDVVENKLITGELVKQACQRHLRDLEDGQKRGLVFDVDSALHVIDFFHSFVRYSKGEWRGRQFKLQPWQQFRFGSVFGWMRLYGWCPRCGTEAHVQPEGYIECPTCKYNGLDGIVEPEETRYLRRFRTAYNEVARKNGKSEESAGLGLYMLDADGEPGAEVYSAATKRDQARLVWNPAAQMVRLSPELSGRIQVLRSNMHVLDTASKFEPLGADADSLDGLNIHCAIVDELHAHKSRSLWDVLETATGARQEPLMWAITTAGFDQTGICYELRSYSVNVLQGQIEDDSWFAYIATLDKDDDPFDERVWIKANPNLGVSAKWDDIRRLAQRAEKTPSALNNFLTKRLNVWTQQETRWISLDIWDENIGDTPAKQLEEMLKGRKCYGGLDLGSVSDLAAWVMAFPRDDDRKTLDILARFWVPEARLYDEENRYRHQYQAWVREGWLTATPGRAIDYDYIKQQILRDGSTYQLVDFNIDRLFQAHQLAGELIDEGLTVVGMGQGFLSMASPMSEFERRLLQNKLNHGGNPVLRWMAGNVAVQQDAAGNLKPNKADSQGKIDGIVALVMALDRAMRHEEPPKSVYDERGVLTF